SRGRGTVLTLSASPAPLAIPGTAGWGVACAAIEAMSRTLAAELAHTARGWSATGLSASAAPSTQPQICP
ncbi:MAG TPA: hypothetical protein VLT34_09205, partial [Arthrobacter sp.]|nr:hypothetical protein [Arthrobacter sp.]